MTLDEYIREQSTVIPAAIAAARNAGLVIPPGQKPVLIGSGSSFNALNAAAMATAVPLRSAFRVVGPQAYLKEMQAASPQNTGPVLVLSQSGASTTSVRAAHAAAERGAPTLIVTCEADSPIGRLPLPKVVLPIGGEPIGPKTKGFTATLAGVLTVLAEAEGRNLPAFSPAAYAQWIEASEQAASRLAVGLDEIDWLVVSGSSRFFGIALEASLKVTEIAGLPAAGFETEELLHGRLHGAGPKSLVIIIAGDREDLEIATATVKAMGDRGVRVLVVNMTETPSPYDWVQSNGAGSAPLDMLAAIVPFQWLAWHMARSRLMTPEAMRYPGLSAALAIKLKTPA